MRDYKVFLKGETEPIAVRADDVNLVSAEGPSLGVFLNFWRGASGDETAEVTVAAVPLEQVRYVLSARNDRGAGARRYPQRRRAAGAV
jgi:hypothetical protein